MVTTYKILNDRLIGAFNRGSIVTLTKIMRCNTNFSNQINLTAISLSKTTTTKLRPYKKPFYVLSMPSAATMLGKCLENMADC